jgi:adenylate cyclase
VAFRRLARSLSARTLALAILAALVLFPITRLDFFQTLESKTLDLRFKAQPTPADPRIVIVTVDGGSLERLPWLSWPWPRQLYGDCLGLLQRWGADVVAFDILYDLPSLYGAADDSILGRNAAAFGQAVFAVALQKRDGRPVPPAACIPVEGNFSGLDSAWTSTPPFGPILDGAAAMGNVSALPDPDGVYRRAALFTRTPEGTVPSLAVAAAWMAAGKPPISISPDELVFGDRSLPLDGSGNLRMRFRGPTATFRYVPIADLLESLQNMAMGQPPVADSTVFQDAIVLVGYTAPGLYDLKPTPYSAVCPGVEVHATVIDNLLSGNAIYRPSAGVSLASAAVVSLLCAAGLIAFRSMILKSLLGLIVLAAYVALCFGLFSSNTWIEMLYPASSGVASVLGGTALFYSHANQQRKQIRTAFSQYLSPAVVERLSRHPDQLRLGGEQRIMTAHFSDLQGFTSFSEKLTPEELVHLLNRYLTSMTDVILDSGGTLDKYIGDAVVAFWNAPIPCEDHAARACRAVLQMRKALVELNAHLREEGKPELKPRTGLNTGLMTVGNMGSTRRFDYTMMGSSVNLASRLEGVNKAYGTYIMVSQATLEAAGPGFCFRELDSIRVVGQKTPVRIFELLGLVGEVPEDVLKRSRQYVEALGLYRDRKFQAAAKAFRSIAGDAPSTILAQRCDEFGQSGAKDDWDGVYDMTSK